MVTLVVKTLEGKRPKFIIKTKGGATMWGGERRGERAKGKKINFVPLRSLESFHEKERNKERKKKSLSFFVFFFSLFCLSSNRFGIQPVILKNLYKPHY